METRPEIQVDIRPTGIQSAVVYAPFNEALDTLGGQGYKIISLPENAQLRIQQGRDSFISRNGNWTREGVLYFPDGKPKLVRNSPILYSAKEATEAHGQGTEFYPSKEQIEQALADSIGFPDENIEIPTDRFDSDALVVYAFGGEQEARDYGEFLRGAGIKKMPVYAVDKNRVDKQNNPFARQMWFWLLDYGSVLYGHGRSLYDAYRLRGVKVGAEGTAPNSESYTPEQISRALNDLKIGGLESQILNKLKR